MNYQEVETTIISLHKKHKHIEWKDIPSAPMDGTRLLLLCKNNKGVVKPDIGGYDNYTTRWWFALTENGIVGEWDTDLGTGDPYMWKELK